MTVVVVVVVTVEFDGGGEGVGGAGVGANFARGISASTFDMTSSFGSGEKAFVVSQTITVTDTRIRIESISHVTQWDSGNAFVASFGTSKEVRMKVVFSDGTMLRGKMPIGSAGIQYRRGC